MMNRQDHAKLAFVEALKSAITAEDRMEEGYIEFNLGCYNVNRSV
jgi:hypothetical protein